MRGNPLSLIATLLLVFLSVIARGDQTIVVDLNSSSAKPNNALELKHETVGATRGELDRTSDKSLSSAPERKETVIGQVGLIVSAKASIYRLPSTRSVKLFTCPRDTCLAITGERKSWHRVLMSDGSSGWIEKSKVNLINYQVLGSCGSGQSADPSCNRIVDTALKFLGISYKWGGNSANGIDCSGFVKAVFANIGISLPRTAREQAQVGIPISSWSDMKPGDRLYFACKGGAVDHCGIYIGNGYFIHSSVRNRGVAVDPITKSLFSRSLVTVRRSS